MSQVVAKIPFAVQEAEGRAIQGSMESLDNLYVARLPENAKDPFVVQHTPGLRLWGTVGSGPIRALQRFRSLLFVVSGNELYSLDEVGTQTFYGVLPGSGLVASVEGPDHALFVTNVGTYAANETTLISVAVNNLRSIGYQDGVAFGHQFGTEKFYVSNIDDLITWNALDFSSADTFGDHLVGLISDHRELWLFGRSTIEIWHNVGAADFLFARSGAGFIEHGCLASFSIAKADNNVYWLGDDKRVYAASGYTPQIISTEQIDYLIAQRTSPETAQAFTYTQENHVFYVLTFSDLTLVYDITTGLWHKRSTFGEDRWRAQRHAHVFGKNLVGDFENGKVYELDLGYYSEDGDMIQRQATSAPLFIDGYGFVMDEFYLEADSGIGVGGGAAEPKFILDYKDGDKNFWEGSFSQSPGDIGQYGKKMRWYGLGVAVQKSIRIKTYDPVPVRIYRAAARLERLNQ